MSMVRPLNPPRIHTVLLMELEWESVVRIYLTAPRREKELRGRIRYKQPEGAWERIVHYIITIIFIQLLNRVKLEQ